MTRVYSPKTSTYSHSQRRSHLLLMLCLPDAAVTLDCLCHFNGVDDAVSRQDITDVASEVQRYHQLVLELDDRGSLLLQGEPLNQCLCLLYALRRGLRIAPDFVRDYFCPQLKLYLQQRGVSKALYDQRNLQALVLYSSRQLVREFSAHDRLLIPICLQYALFHSVPVVFSQQQTEWLAAKREYCLAQRIIGCWQKQGYQQTTPDDVALLALLFSQLYIPVFARPSCAQEEQLMLAVKQLIDRFQHLSGMPFSRHDELCSQLYSHLAQALERSRFAIGIDSTLVEDVSKQYPRLVRTTRAALEDFEKHFSLQFSYAEMGLITIIFGAWLMHEGALYEKQVLLLTDSDEELEKRVEQQLRELTLLPLNIKYLTIEAFQRHSAPKGISLVVTPYITALPLFSPPLIHVELPLGKQQQRSIRTLLES